MLTRSLSVHLGFVEPCQRNWNSSLPFVSTSQDKDQVTSTNDLCGSAQFQRSLLNAVVGSGFRKTDQSLTRACTVCVDTDPTGRVPCALDRAISFSRDQRKTLHRKTAGCLADDWPRMFSHLPLAFRATASPPRFEKHLSLQFTRNSQPWEIFGRVEGGLIGLWPLPSVALPSVVSCRKLGRRGFRPSEIPSNVGCDPPLPRSSHGDDWSECAFTQPAAGLRSRVWNTTVD